MAARVPEVGIRSSPRSLLLGAEPAASDDAQQEDQRGSSGKDRRSESSFSRHRAASR